MRERKAVFFRFQMAGSALRRLIAEYKRKIRDDRCEILATFLLFPSELTTNPPEGILAGPVSDENFFEWEALITFVDEISSVFLRRCSVFV